MGEWAREEAGKQQVEVLLPADRVPQDVRWLAHLLDNAFVIPGTRYRIGIDGVVGLIPGFGDAFGAALASYLVYRAAQTGVPRAALLRMVWNVAFDTIVGAVPILGDAFDLALKCNQRNVAIFRDAAARSLHPRTHREIARLFLALSAFVVLLMSAAVILAAAMLARLIGSF